MDLWTAFDKCPWARSSAPAVIDSAGQTTFSDLRRRAVELADEILLAGFPPESCATLVLPNSAAFAAGLLALLRTGAAVGLVSPKYERGEWDAIREGLGAAWRLTTPDVEKRRGTSGETARETALSGGLMLVEERRLHRFAKDLDPAVIKFSSGSTGIPKGIALSAENILCEARNVASMLGLRPGDRILAPVPLCHSYGFDLGVLPALYSGATLVTEDFFVPRRSLARLGEDRVRVFLGVPAMYRFMMEAAPTDPPDLSRVDHLLSCTAPLDPESIRRFHGVFRGVVCQHYGASETGAVANHVAGEVLSRPESVGRPVSGVDVRIVDEAGRSLPPDAEGEVAVRSGAVAQGYVMGAPAGASPFRDGAFHMGDRGSLDSGGFLKILGRLDDLINIGGLKVFPVEIGRVLESHASVREAVAYGVDDEAGGQVMEAMVTLREGMTEEDLIRFCHDRLAGHKVPRRIRIVNELPRGATGKVKVPRGGST